MQCSSSSKLGLAITLILCRIIVDVYGYTLCSKSFLSSGFEPSLWEKKKIILNSNFFTVTLFYFLVSLIFAITIWLTDSSFTRGYLNMTPNRRQIYHRDSEVSEREKLFAGVGSASDLSAGKLLLLQSDTQIRNHFITIIGDEVIDSAQQS